MFIFDLKSRTKESQFELSLYPVLKTKNVNIEQGETLANILVMIFKY